MERTVSVITNPPPLKHRATSRVSVLVSFQEIKFQVLTEIKMASLIEYAEIMAEAIDILNGPVGRGQVSRDNLIIDINKLDELIAIGTGWIKIANSNEMDTFTGLFQDMLNERLESIQLIDKETGEVLHDLTYDVDIVRQVPFALLNSNVLMSFGRGDIPDMTIELKLDEDGFHQQTEYHTEYRDTQYAKNFIYQTTLDVLVNTTSITQQVFGINRALGVHLPAPISRLTTQYLVG